MNTKPLKFGWLCFLLTLPLLGCGGGQSDENAGTLPTGNIPAAHQSETENTIKH
jgi:hypothetical protein